MSLLGDLRHSDPVIQRIIDYLRGQRVARGEDTLTWTPGGVNYSDVLTVSHGLGYTPTQVLTTSRVPIGNTVTRGLIVEPDPATFGPKTFQVRGWMTGTAPGAGAQMPFSWQASR